MGNDFNCCCEEKREKPEPSFERLINYVLSTHPLKKHSSDYALEKFLTSEKEIKIRNTNVLSINKNESSGQVSIKEYSEDKYIKAIEELLGFTLQKERGNDKQQGQGDVSVPVMKRKNQHQSTKNLKDLKNVSNQRMSMISVNSNANNTNNLNKRPSTKASSSILLTYVNNEVTNIIEADRIKNIIYTSITPDYNSLFDSIIHSKPKSSFILFIFSFTNDTIEEKADLFLKLIQSTDMLPCVLSFQTLIQLLITLHFKFSSKILSCVNKNFSQWFVKETMKNFKINITNSDIIQWIDINEKYNSIKFDATVKLSNKIINELISIINNSPASVKGRSENRRPKASEILNPNGMSFQDGSYVEVSQENLIELFRNNSFLYDPLLMRKTINQYLQEEYELNEKKRGSNYYMY